MSKRPTDETPADDFLVATLPDAHVVDAAQVAADAAPSVPESHLPGPVKKQRTWERHRWTYQHDEALFDQVLKHEAWSKKFGNILKSWSNVGSELEGQDAFGTWGKPLKTDMLRRRFDKVYSESMEAMKKKGVGLDAHDDVELTDIDRKCLQIRDLMEQQGHQQMEDQNKHKTPTTPSNMLQQGGSNYATPSTGLKKTAKMREEELHTINGTVTKFLERHSQMEGLPEEFLNYSVGNLAQLTGCIESLEGKVDGSDNWQKIAIEQIKVTRHLVKQNDLLLTLLTKVLCKHLQ